MLLPSLVTSLITSRCRVFLTVLERFLSSISCQRHWRGFLRMQRSHVRRSHELLEGGVLPAASPHGVCPSDSDTVSVCLRVSAQRAGRKRVAELALALLTHWLVPEPNHHLVFTENLSWKAGNPLPSCFVPWPVFLTVVFSFWLLVSFHLTSLLSQRTQRSRCLSPPSHPAPPCTSKKDLGEPLTSFSIYEEFLMDFRVTMPGFVPIIAHWVMH